MAQNARAQFQAGAQQASLGRCQRDAQPPRHIGPRHFLYVSQNKDFTQQRWDASDLLPQHQSEFPLTGVGS